MPTELADEASSSVELHPRRSGRMPSYYLHYYYETRDVLAEQLAGATRAEDVMAIERELLELYRDPTLDRKPALLEQRGGAFYSEAAAQLIASLHAGTGDVQVVDVRNDGALAGPARPTAVVEVPARIDRDGAHPVPLAPLAPEMRGLVQRAKAYEELAIEAAADRRRAGRPPGAPGEPARARPARGRGPARGDPRGERPVPAAVRASLSGREPWAGRSSAGQRATARIRSTSSRSATSALISAIFSRSAGWVLTSRSWTSEATS